MSACPPLERDEILARIPHQGASCLLDRCEGWSDTTLSALTDAHLRADNPMRAHGRLGPLVGAEMAMQAAALHGALQGGSGGAPGYLALLRGLDLHCTRLDDPAFGTLRIAIEREQRDSAGMIYSFIVQSSAGETLVNGRGVVMFRPSSPRQST